MKEKRRKSKNQLRAKIALLLREPKKLGHLIIYQEIIGQPKGMQ